MELVFKHVRETINASVQNNNAPLHCIIVSTQGMVMEGLRLIFYSSRIMSGNKASSQV